MATQKAKKTYYERNREKILLKMKQRYQQDPDYREKTKQLARKRYHEDEAYRKATIERAKKRYRELKARKPSIGEDRQDPNDST